MRRGGLVMIHNGLVLVQLFRPCCGEELSLETGLYGRLRGTNEEKIPAVVPHVHHN